MYSGYFKDAIAGHLKKRFSTHTWENFHTRNMIFDTARRCKERLVTLPFQPIELHMLSSQNANRNGIKGAPTASHSFTAAESNELPKPSGK
ncbi:hypothetical protein AVEN_160536-1 [Araneus ventricosus]|uniref:Uncharacterized protein n=1 Tax=Araneus ventricosus TaxID=182803 RepID=A0A4Y2PE69_ARAVE|nr:hypothetical protein AVEN_160536-1 [Araneus ventricosus]